MRKKSEYKPSTGDRVFGVFFVGTQISLVSLVFAGIWTTPFEMFWQPTVICAIFLTIVVMWVNREDDRSIFRGFGMVLGYALALSIVVVSFGFGVLHAYKLIPVDPSAKVVAAVTLCSLILGVGSYLIRRTYRMTWGATEVAAGLLIVIYRTASNSNLDVEYFIAFITAGIYLMVRGFDNLEQGSKVKHEKRKAAEKSRREIEGNINQIAAPPSGKQ